MLGILRKNLGSVRCLLKALANRPERLRRSGGKGNNRNNSVTYSSRRLQRCHRRKMLDGCQKRSNQTPQKYRE